MARYAKGKRAVLIDDRSGFKIRHKDARTEWTGSRVYKGDFESKHPQLEPQKYIPAPRGNSLFRPRTDNDQVPTNIPLGPLHGRFSAQAAANIGTPVIGLVETANGLQLNASQGLPGVALVQPISGVSASALLQFPGQSVDKVVTVVGGNPSNHPYHNFGSSNKFAINGSTATADVTLALFEGNTYTFDQSDNSNSGHPLRFSETPNGTHAGGSEYTTGVTVNGIPGQAGAYTRIVVPTGAPTLYYYCTNHSGMGWTANTPNSPVIIAATEDALGLEATAQQGTVTKFIGQSITGVGATAGQGSVTLNLTEDAIGLQATAQIGQVKTNSTESLEGLQATAEQGTVGVSLTIGVTGLQAVAGRGTIGNQVDATIIPSGFSTTASLGSVTAVDITPVAVTGLQATTNRGTINVTSPSWGNFPWGHDTWGQ